MRSAIILLVIFCTFLKSVHAQVCSDPLNTIYGLDQNGDIVQVNVNDASVGSAISSSGDAGYPGFTNNANAIGLNIQNGMFYYFQDNASGSQQFVSYDPATSTYTMLANSPISGSVVKGCISADGTGYYCIDGAGKLCYYNIAGNTWVQISSNLVDQTNTSLAGTFAALGNGDMSIDGLGNLWIVVASSTQWGLYKINAPLPTTPTPSVTLNEMIPPVQATPTGLPFVGIAYNATGQIYLCTVNDLYLLENDLSITHINTFSTPGVVVDLTSCNYPIDILPLSWTSFTASLQNNNSVLLSWSVSQQQEETKYYIERSSNGKDWENIGYQQNSAGEGEIDYSFTDARPSNGINYYRIRTSGFDGKGKYSEIKTINIASGKHVNIWPIPATSKINIQVPLNTNSNGRSVQIFNPSGQEVSSTLLYGGVNIVDVSSLKVGYYFARVTLSNGEIINQKFIKL